jgi:hypothetical protein
VSIDLVDGYSSIALNWDPCARSILPAEVEAKRVDVKVLRVSVQFVVAASAVEVAVVAGFEVAAAHIVVQVYQCWLSVRVAVAVVAWDHWRMRDDRVDSAQQQSVEWEQKDLLQWLLLPSPLPQRDHQRQPQPESAFAYRLDICHPDYPGPASKLAEARHEPPIFPFHSRAGFAVSCWETWSAEHDTAGLSELPAQTVVEATRQRHLHLDRRSGRDECFPAARWESKGAEAAHSPVPLAAVRHIAPAFAAKLDFAPEDLSGYWSPRSPRLRSAPQYLLADVRQGVVVAGLVQLQESRVEVESRGWHEWSSLKQSSRSD